MTYIFLLKYANMMNGSANLTNGRFQRVLGYLVLILLFAPSAYLQAQQIEFPTESEVVNAMHVVQKGETLYGIAKQYSTSPSEIKRLNSMSEATIYPGQMLVVTSKVAATRSTVARSSQPAEQSYRSTARSNVSSVSALDAYAKKVSKDYVGPTSQVATELKMLEEMPTEPTKTTDDILLASTTRGGESLAPVGSISDLPEKVTKTSTEWYRVQEGDDIFSIADTYEVRAEDISAWNSGIQTVRPGDVLMVRKSYEAVSRESLAQPSTDSRYATQSRSLSNMQQAAARGATSEWGNSRGQATTTSPQAFRSSLSTVDAQYINSRDIQPAAAAKVESGQFVRFEYPGLEKVRFYGIHKSLPQGTKIKMGIPNNPGYIEVVIIGKLDYQSKAIIGLSPACLQILEGAGTPKEVTIAYD